MVSSLRRWSPRAICSEDGVLETLHNRKTGEVIRIIESTPECLRFEFGLQPGAAIPGGHLHPESEQRITVTAGELHLRVAGRHHILRSGETLAVPAGTPHFQWNPGEVEVHAVEEYRPAGRLHAMFATFFRLAGEGMLSERGRVLAPLTVAAFFAEFQSEVRASPRLLHWGLALLAPLARAWGSHRSVRRLNPEYAEQ